jgi:hypothetical protein
MNYTTIYSDLVQRGKTRSTRDLTIAALEQHHIVPRCMGGTDDQANLVLLTYEEHLLAHLLLTRIHPNHGGVTLALLMMLQHSWAHTGRASFNKKYARWRRNVVADLKKLKWWTNGVDHKRSEECPGDGYELGMLNVPWNKGIPRTAEQRAHHSALMKGRPQPAKTAEAKAKSGHRGTDWWTDGTRNKRATSCPGPEWKVGITAAKVGSKGMSWWNNGVLQKQSRECPGEGWAKGHFKITTPNPSRGTKWWTNGKDNLRAADRPAEGWRNGVTR